MLFGINDVFPKSVLIAKNGVKVTVKITKISICVDSPAINKEWKVEGTIKKVIDKKQGFIKEGDKIVFFIHSPMMFFFKKASEVKGTEISILYIDKFSEFYWGSLEVLDLN